MIICPHCGHELTREEAKHISRVYAGSAKSEKKAASSAENGRLYAGRPKGSKNKAPRSDKGVKRGPRTPKPEER
jgi:hypothetical protein